MCLKLKFNEKEYREIYENAGEMQNLQVLSL